MCCMKKISRESILCYDYYMFYYVFATVQLNNTIILSEARV